MLAPAFPRGNDQAVLSGAADKLRAGGRARAGLRPPEFASDEQRAFFESEAPELLYSGWMGAGKSRILCEKAWSLALHHPGAELGIFRKVKASMPATTIRTFWEEVADLRYVVKVNRTESWVDLAQPGARPSRIWFLGLDPDPITGTPTKVGSLNLDWAGVDEAIEITEADWIMLGGRLRRDAIGYRQLAGATNPASPKHWLKVHFTPATADRVFLVASGNKFLPPDYEARLKSLGTGVHAQRLGKGLWVAAEGTIWLLPDDQIQRPDQTAWKRTVAGIDWGYVHAFACEVVAESGTGRRAVIDEIYERGMLINDLIPRLLELKADLGIEVFYADPSEPEYIATCRGKGLNVVAATNDVLPGITAVENSLKRGMTVSPDCSGLLGEIPEYVWQRDRASGQEKEKPIEINDDGCDALRYAVMGLDAGAPGLLEYYQRLAAERAAAAAPR